MMNTSQTVEDVIDESKKKWKNFEIDRSLGDRAKELFESAKTKIDPRIYKGESPAYRREETHESGNQVLDRMAKKSPYTKQALSKELYDIKKDMSPDKQGYNFKRDTAGGYNTSFEDVAQQYLMGEGKELYAHLRKKGRDFYDIKKIGTADLEGAVAALATNGTEAALLGSNDFEQKVSELADHYGISVERATSYVMAHEFTHASQKGKYFDDPILAELDVEHTLKEYFTQRGEQDLADVASDRAANVTRNYGGIGAYKMPKGISERGGLENYLGKYAGGSSVSGKASAESGSTGSGESGSSSAGSYASASAASSN